MLVCVGVCVCVCVCLCVLEKLDAKQFNALRNNPHTHTLLLYSSLSVLINTLKAFYWRLHSQIIDNER